MSKSKQVQDMYLKLLNDKLYEIWCVDQQEKETAEMIKQLGCEELFKDSIEYNKKKRKKLTEEAEELLQSWRKSL